MRSWLFVLTIMLSVGCGGKTNDTTTTPTATATIGSSGGALTSADGHATITIPVGALPTATAVTIVGVQQPSIPGATVIGPAYRFGPADTKLASAATIAIPYGAGRIGMEMYFAADNATFVAIDTWHFDGGVMSATTTSLGTFVVAVPDGSSSGVMPGGSSGGGGTGLSSSSSSGGFGDPECTVTCEGPLNVDAGIGCDCTTTCHNVEYKLQCRCGSCVCTQNGIATAQTTVPIDSCSNGAEALRSTYNSVCGYPASPSSLGGGGPTSNDAGVTCE